MAEVRSAKTRANRAVAALSEASGITAVDSAAAISCGVLCLRSGRAPIVRRRTFAELESSRRQRCPLIGLREELARVRALPLTTETPAVREDFLVADRIAVPEPTGSPEVVAVVPDLLPTPAALADPDAVAVLRGHLSSGKRGHCVTDFALVQRRFAATDVAATAPLPALRLAPMLDIVAQLPFLRRLDLRGVDWSAAENAPVVGCFLRDLVLAAPRLEALMVGVALCRAWPAGWWQRLPELHTFVVGSRSEEATCSPLATTEDREAGLQPPLWLDKDFFTMLATETRPWRVRLWCRLAKESLARLLNPAPAAYATLVELAINLDGNGDVCAGLADTGDGAAGAPGAEVGGLASAGAAADSAKAKAKGKRGVAADSAVDAPLFPALATCIVANVDERIVSVAELLGRFYALAPALTSFEVCNTARLPPPVRVKGARRARKAAKDGAM